MEAYDLSSEPSELSEHEIAALDAASKNVNDSQTGLEELNKLHEAMTMAKFRSEGNNEVATTLLSMLCTEHNVVLVKRNNLVHWEPTMLSLNNSLKEMVKAIIDKIVKWWTVLSNLFTNLKKQSLSKIESIRELKERLRTSAPRIFDELSSMDDEAIFARMSIKDGLALYYNFYDPPAICRQYNAACVRSKAFVRELKNPNAPLFNHHSLPERISDALMVNSNADKIHECLYTLDIKLERSPNIRLLSSSQLFEWADSLISGYYATIDLLKHMETIQKENQTYLKSMQSSAQTDAETAKKLKEDFQSISNNQSVVIKTLLRPGHTVLNECLKKFEKLVKEPNKNTNEHPTTLSIREDYSDDTDDYDLYSPFDSEDIEFPEEDLQSLGDSIKSMGSKGADAIKKFIQWIKEIFSKLFSRKDKQNEALYEVRKNISTELAVKREHVETPDHNKFLDYVEPRRQYLIYDDKIDVHTFGMKRDKFHKKMLEDVGRLIHFASNPSEYANKTPQEVMREALPFDVAHLVSLTTAYNEYAPGVYKAADKKQWAYDEVKAPIPKPDDVDLSLTFLLTMLNKEANQQQMLRRKYDELTRILSKQVESSKMPLDVGTAMSKRLTEMVVSAGICSDVSINLARYFLYVRKEINAKPSKNSDNTKTSESKSS